MVILLGKNNKHTFYPSRLLRLSAWRYARQHPWQTWLSFTGIMLGVMMVVAIDLANNSSGRAFELSLETINGNISHQIVGGSEGVDDDVYTRLRTELSIRRSAPGLSGLINIQDQSFTLLGIDALSEASLQRQRPGAIQIDNGVGGLLFTAFARTDAVVMSEELAADLGLEVGASFTAFLRGRTGQDSSSMMVMLAATFPSAGAVATENLIFADISVAQKLLNKEGKINSIDLILNQRQIENISAWLPTNLTLVNAQNRNDSLQQMRSAFHINLLAMSMLSLLVAGLLIYNTVTLSVIRRQNALGIFRSQGVSRHEIFYLVIGEAAMLGIIASVIGLLMGFALAQMLVGLVSQAIPDASNSVDVSAFLVEPWTLLKGFCLGVGITLVSAALPAWHATHCAPLTLQQRSVEDKRWHTRMPWLALAGMIMMGMGYVLLQSEYAALVGGFVALTMIVFGFCFMVPGAMSVGLSMVLGSSVKYLSLPARIALRNVQSGISRTGLAVAALTVALSVTIGVGVMVDSFRGTVILWLEQSFNGDIEIAAQHFPEQLAVDLNALEDVLEVAATITKTVESQYGQVRLNVSTLPAQQSYYLKAGDDAQLVRFNAGEGVLVSEPLAYLQSLEIGDTILLFTDSGAQSFPVLGIFYDYTPSLGLIGLHESLYSQWWNDQTISHLSIIAGPEFDSVDTLLPAVRAVLGEYDEDFFAISNRDIRASTLAIFDRTFAITNVLRILALLVAFVGVLSALMALLLERLREYALLRASGMTPGQVIKLVLGQALIMGVCAGVLAIPLGLIMSDVLIDVINKRSFGWSMQHTLPLSVLGQALVLALVAALLAGLYPALKAAKVSPAAVLREE